MSLKVTRRRFLDLAGAATIGLSAGAARAQSRGRENMPNVLVVVMDTLRRDHVGRYSGGRMRTPALDALAADSLSFTRATPEAMPTIPARRAIHSGTRTWPFDDWERRAGNGTGVWGWQHIPDAQPTLAEQMRGAGYQTIMVTDVPHMFKPGMNFTRGFDYVDWVRGQEGDSYRPFWQASDVDLDDFMHRTGQGEDLTTKYGDSLLARELETYIANTADRRTEEDYFAPQVFRSATRFVKTAPPGTPWFMVVDSFDPHEPWDAPDNYVRLYDPETYDDPEPITPRYGSSDYLTERQLNRMRTLYAAEVTMADRWLGWFLDRIEDTGVLDDTLVILTSDHGIALGEHGAVGKPAFALWGEMTDVPFFLKMPGTARPASSELPVMASTHDVASTVLSASGVAVEADLEGIDLSALWSDPEAPSRTFLTSGLNDYLWASDGNHTLISRRDGAEMHLYDIQSDPGQTRDLAGDRPDLARDLFARAKDEAGGELPDYPDGPPG